jgi:hypothetical protein
MEGSVASLNAAAAGTVVLYEALRQRRRNAPPADTRTPRPERSAVTPQEEGMDDIADAEGDEAEMDAESAADLEREDGERVTSLESDGADDVNDDGNGQAVDVRASDEEREPEPPAAVEAPKKRATRAKKPAAEKRPTTRKKPAAD